MLFLFFTWETVTWFYFFSVRIPAGSTGGGDRKLELEDRARRDDWPRRPGEPDRHCRKTTNVASQRLSPFVTITVHQIKKGRKTRKVQQKVYRKLFIWTLFSVFFPLTFSIFLPFGTFGFCSWMFVRLEFVVTTSKEGLLQLAESSPVIIFRGVQIRHHN